MKSNFTNLSTEEELVMVRELIFQGHIDSKESFVTLEIEHLDKIVNERFITKEKLAKAKKQYEGYKAKQFQADDIFILLDIS